MSVTFRDFEFPEFTEWEILFDINLHDILKQQSVSFDSGSFFPSKRHSYLRLFKNPIIRGMHCRDTGLFH